MTCPGSQGAAWSNGDICQHHGTLWDRHGGKTGKEPERPSWERQRYREDNQVVKKAAGTKLRLGLTLLALLACQSTGIQSMILLYLLANKHFYVQWNAQ